MEQHKSYFVECLDKGDAERFRLLGGADRDDDYYEDDEYDYEGDEGDEGDQAGMSKMFKCVTKRKKTAQPPTAKKPPPRWVQMYLQPYSSKQLSITTPIIPYGTNYNGVNLFGVYFWGLLLTLGNEGVYVVMSQIFKGKTQTFNFDKKDPKWEFTALNYKDTTQYFFIMWGIIFLAYLVISYCRLRSLTEDQQKNDFVGRLFATLLLILTFIPAALAGDAWENELQLLKSGDPEEFFEYQGWIVLITVPMLWPIICSCYVFVFAVLGSMYTMLCLGKSRFASSSNYDEGDEGDEGEDSDY